MPGRNVLIVTEAFLMGGLETRLNGEIEYLTSRGDEVHLAAGHLQRENVTPACRSVAEIDVDYLDDVSRLSRGVDQLTTLIEELQPSHVLIQPFRSLLTGAIACYRLSIPYTMVMHGPASYQVPEFGKTYNLLTQEAIRLSDLIAVSETLGHLAPTLSSGRRPSIVGNAVNRPRYPRQLADTDSRGDWAIISRLDLEKAPVLYAALPWICEVASSVTIMGDGGGRPELEEFCQEHGLKVNFAGEVSNALERMPEFDVVAGMARVILEAMASQVHACLIGYKGFQGFVDSPEAYDLALVDNFTGTNLPALSHGAFLSQLPVTAAELKAMADLVDERRQEQYALLDKAIEDIGEIDPDIAQLSHFARKTARLKIPLNHPDVSNLARRMVDSRAGTFQRSWDRFIALLSR